MPTGTPKKKFSKAKRIAIAAKRLETIAVNKRLAEQENKAGYDKMTASRRFNSIVSSTSDRKLAAIRAILDI